MATKLLNGELVTMGDAEYVAFEDSRTLTLSQAKREMRQKIEARRDLAERSGFILPATGMRYESGALFMCRLSILAARARTAKAANAQFSVSVVAMDDSQSNMNANEVLSLELSAGDHLVACSANARTLRQAVNNAVDVPTALGIDIEFGWP